MPTPSLRTARPALAAALAVLPLLLVAGCSADEPAVRGENGSGVDTKASQAPGNDADQSGKQSSDPDAG